MHNKKPSQRKREQEIRKLDNDRYQSAVNKIIQKRKRLGQKISIIKKPSIFS